MKKIIVLGVIIIFIGKSIFCQNYSKGKKGENKMLFDHNYKLLEDMVADNYYPQESVGKIIKRIEKLIRYLESGIKDVNKIQKELDDLTDFINNLEDEFNENESEIETVARDSIGTTIEYILNYFNINIDIETAIRNREW